MVKTITGSAHTMQTAVQLGSTFLLVWAMQAFADVQLAWHRISSLFQNPVPDLWPAAGNRESQLPGAQEAMGRESGNMMSSTVPTLPRNVCCQLDVSTTHSSQNFACT